MFVKKVSVLVVIALASVAVSENASVLFDSELIEQFNPNFSSPTLRDHFQCIVDSFIEILMDNEILTLWRNVHGSLQQKISIWERCVEKNDFETCNRVEGVNAFKELKNYMHLVGKQDSRIIPDFLRTQAEQCGPEGPR